MIYVTAEALRVRDGLRFRRTDIRRGLRVAVQPTSEPIDIETARAHLRIEATGSPASHPDDALITDIYLPAARELVENYVGRACAQQTLELSLSEFPYCADYIELPMAPLLGVESITYLDGAGASQTFTDFNADLYAQPGTVQLSLTGMWPSVGFIANAVIVRYQAGYAGPNDSPTEPHIPASIRAGIMLVLTQLYNGNPCEVLPDGVKCLLDPYKLPLGFA